MASGPGWVSKGAGHPLTILIPVYNDWEALGLLLGTLDDVLAAHSLEAGVLIVDDGSTTEPSATALKAERPFRALRDVDVLALRRNLGHQRALAIGIAFVEDRGRCEALVVMDGDGEDDPGDVPRLVAELKRDGGRRIVFAERTRRSESTTFRVFYAWYRWLHYVLTGYRVRVGNFSIIPRVRLESLAAVSELWNHYAAAAFRSRQPVHAIPTHRAERLHGRSRMNFISLITHGLSAISVYSEIVGVRLLIATAILMIVDLLGIGTVVYIRLATNLAIPGWATYGVGILSVILIQLMMLMIVFVFVILSGRNSSAFVPKRDYVHYVAGVRPLYAERAG